GIQHHALEPGAGGARGNGGGTGGAREVMQSLLVSAVCVHQAAGAQPGGCGGSYPRVLRALTGTERFGNRSARARPFPFLLARVFEAFHAQRTTPCARRKTWGRAAAHLSRRGRGGEEIRPGTR